MLKGVDISHWQIIKDYSVYDKSGLAFIYVKATDGRAQDPMFKTHMNGIARTHLLEGFYHFWENSVDPILQAKNFVNTIHPYLTPFSLPPMLDLEDRDHKMDPVTYIYNVKQFLTYVEQNTGYLPGIYIGKDYLQEFMANTQQLNRYYLWDACYRNNPATPYGGWNKPNFWQYSNHTRVEGDDINKDKLDADLFMGTIEEFLALTHSKTFPGNLSPIDWIKKYNVKTF